MNFQSIPPLVIAGITFYVGLYHLVLFSRLPGKKEHFSFALICVSIAFYDFFSAGLYSSTTLAGSEGWQRAQIIAMCLAAAFCMWFAHYHNPTISKKWVRLFSVINLIIGTIMLFERCQLTWTGLPANKHITLPFGFTVNYIESGPGPLMIIFFLVQIITVLFVFWTTISLFKTGNRKKAWSFLAAFLIFVSAVLHDSCIVMGFFQSLYIIEYGFFLLIVLMAFSFSGDIVQAVLMRDALKESENRFATAFRSNPGAISISRVDDGTYVDVNDSFTTMYGYTREEAIGQTCMSLQIWADEIEQFQDRNRHLESNGAVQGLDFTFRRKNGQTGAGINSAGLIELNGIPHFISITYDVTEYKQAQEEKERLENHLHQAQKMEAIGTLASGIAHDFNNILQTITGFTQLLINRPPPVPENLPYLTEIELAVERASNLTQRLLTFGRKVKPELKVVSLNQVVERITGILERTIPKMIQIEIQMADNLLTIQADPNQLERVLMNLGANARDAMPNGGRITIQTENFTFVEGGAENLELKPDHYVLLRFSDTGQGMDPATQQRLFEPFFTTKDAGRGTGLGMSTVYGIVTAHGGQITCQSSPGQGTTFTIYLPANNHHGSIQEAPCPADDYRELTGSETILLVDDEETIIETGREFLENEGYQVITANSGEQALQIYRNHAPNIDLVILDLGMPGMGGYYCLGKLVEINPKIKVLIISGYAEKARIQESMATGASGFMTKPFKLNDILKKMRDLLDPPPTFP